MAASAEFKILLGVAEVLRSLPGKLGQAQLHGADAGRLSHGPIFLLLNKR